MRLVLLGEAHACADGVQRLVADDDLYWKHARERRVGWPVQAAVVREQLGETQAMHAQHDRLTVRRKDPVARRHGQTQAGLRGSCGFGTTRTASASVAVNPRLQRGTAAARDAGRLA